MKELLTKVKNFFLCLKYPFLKVYNVWTGKFCGYGFTEYDNLPYGWQQAFGKQLLEDIKSAYKEDKKKNRHLKWKDALRFTQIKEKYGELCLYADATKRISNVLRKYELLSICYCPNCGKPVRYCTKGWVSYLCEDCFNKYVQEINLSQNEIDKFRELDRLTIEDIPKSTIYENGEYKEIDLEDKYDIDFKKLWDL